MTLSGLARNIFGNGIGPRGALLKAIVMAAVAVAMAASSSATNGTPPTFTKSFSPNPIFVGGTSTLTFTIDNTAALSAATSLAFSDTLPAGVVIETPNGAVDGCSGSLTAPAGGGAVTYTGG